MKQSRKDDDVEQHTNTGKKEMYYKDADNIHYAAPGSTHTASSYKMTIYKKKNEGVHKNIKIEAMKLKKMIPNTRINKIIRFSEQRTALQSQNTL